jgi:hypothetical protein
VEEKYLLVAEVMERRTVITEDGKVAVRIIGFGGIAR